jgi:hypothetical protein
MKRSALASAAVVLVLGLPLADNPRALADQPPAVCSYTVENGTVSPGLSMTPASGRWQVRPGPIDCVGSVDGKRITGRGVIVGSGPLEGTCALGSGSGTQFITIPTAGGEVHITQPTTFQWAGAGGPFQGPRMSGSFVFWATKGDCVNQPVTGYNQLTQAEIRS